jgi:hypothetical protein
MSQIYKAGVSGTPSVPTAFTTDQVDSTTASFPMFTGTVVPVGNTLRVVGIEGIQTFQSMLVPGVIEVGYNGGTTTTVDAVTKTIMTLTPPNNSAQTYQFLLVGYDSANGVAFGGQLLAVARVVGGVATVLLTPDRFYDMDVTLAAAAFSIIASGGNLLLQVTGVLGHTIDWSAINAAGVITAT